LPGADNADPIIRSAFEAYHRVQPQAPFSAEQSQYLSSLYSPFSLSGPGAPRRGREPRKPLAIDPQIGGTIVLFASLILTHGWMRFPRDGTGDRYGMGE